jgi:hypothetical protein
MHPERSAMIASASNTATAPRSTFPLPPDVAAARKKRMNADLVSAMIRPCPPGANPSIKGIGLYTHIEGPARASPDPQGKDTQSEPEFLPFKGPAGNGAMGSQMSEEALKVWEELRDAVEEEETIIGKTELGLKELKKRYGGLEVPDTSKPTTHSRRILATRSRKVTMAEDGAAQTGTTAAPGNPIATANGRRPSLGAVMATLAAGNGDGATGGTEVERGRTTEVTTTTRVFKSYAPDPRNRGR